MTNTTAPRILVVMGVSGSGKSTLAGLLAGRLGWPLQEGDDLHPAENVAKMEAGIPLTDEDRWPWLGLIRDWIADRIAAGESAIVTCSALRRSYREILALPGVEFVHLEGTRHDLAERLGRRLGHFMPASLLDSQLETLEPLGPDEAGFVVDSALPTQEAVQQVLDWLEVHGTPTAH
ncbi:D-gluconate kinase, thermosensitive [Microbacterium sp. 8M]|uniref:gluconokinase n=1 Tax=Microbacterium sp. 8M TaxID=2653153 RepID=UPI0012F1354B|nr:gluconokinase [Microbacterium sp. 8M]VXB50656.1 D-gluconate kinase, thermosensitive [Microbacterium sp. 8M]